MTRGFFFLHPHLLLKCYNNYINLNHNCQRWWRWTPSPHTVSPCHVAMPCHHCRQLEMKRPRTRQQLWHVLGQMYVFFSYCLSFTNETFIYFKLLTMTMTRWDREMTNNEGDQNKRPKRCRGHRYVFFFISIISFTYSFFFYPQLFYSDDDDWPQKRMGTTTVTMGVSRRNCVLSPRYFFFYLLSFTHHIFTSGLRKRQRQRRHNSKPNTTSLRPPPLKKQLCRH